MTDSTLNRYLASGTTTQRLAFVPDPPTPASGPSPSYLWWDTTLQAEYAYNFGTSTWVAVGGGGAGTVTTTGSPASGNLTAFSGATSITSGDLSGDITTSGTLATTISNNAIITAKITNANVTLAKVSNATANSVLVGSGATGSGASYSEITLGAGLTMTGATLSASGSGAFTLFSTTVTSGSQASVTVSSIPNTSKNMQIVITGRSTAAAALASVNLQINGDTGANYDGLSLQANGSSASVFSGGIGATVNYIGNIPAASATSNVASNTTVTLTNYSGTTFQKSGFYQDSLKTSTASASNLYTETGSVWWRNTAAINSVKVFPSVGNWVDGSVVQVYLY